MTSIDTWISENIPDVVMDDAAAWLARLDSEQCNEADRAAFACWLAEDPVHRAAFEELSEVWARLRTLTVIGDEIERSNVTRLPVARTTAPTEYSQSSQRPRSDWSTLVASLLVLGGVLFHMAFSTPTESWATGAAETKTIELADGSVIELNGRSEVMVRLTEHERQVDLINGEAIFDVAKDSRPFIVNTPLGSIAALGTRFGVDARQYVVEVAVVEGVVSVSTERAKAPLTEFDADTSTFASEQLAFLQAGDGAELSADTLRQLTLSADDLQDRLSWLEGTVRFDQQPLTTVLEEMRRYTSLNIHVGDQSLMSLRISGEYSTDDIDGFLSQLSDEYGVLVVSSGRSWVVLRSRQ